MRRCNRGLSPTNFSLSSTADRGPPQLNDKLKFVGQFMHQVEIATTQQTLLDSPVMTLNMGPQHPSTHGVLRVILKLDGETVIDLDCDIGYLHRGMEKIAENRMYPMIAPYWDRLDYIAAVSNGLVWVETVEQMMGLA